MPKAGRDTDWLLGALSMLLLVASGVLTSYDGGTDTFTLPEGAPHRDVAIEWLKLAGSQEGQDTFNPVKGSIPARTDGDPGAQAKLIDNAVSQKVGGIVVSMANPDALKTSIEAAVSAGIPVITINSGSDVAASLGVLAHVGQLEDAALDALQLVARAGLRRERDLEARLRVVLRLRVDAKPATFDCGGIDDSLDSGGGVRGDREHDQPAPSKNGRRINSRPYPTMGRGNSWLEAALCGGYCSRRGKLRSQRRDPRLAPSWVTSRSSSRRYSRALEPSVVRTSATAVAAGPTISKRTRPSARLRPGSVVDTAMRPK